MSTIGTKALTKYLAYYAEPEAIKYETFPDGFRHVLIIPVYDEPRSFIEDLLRAEAVTPDTLIILILNVPTGDEQLAAKLRTRVLLDKLKQDFSLQWEHPCLAHVKLFATGTAPLLVVDRVNTPIPKRQGVGLARKIGADIACRLISLKKIESPWIYCSDADTRLPRNYFTIFLPQGAACIFPFRHVGSTGKLATATLLYEASLHYYVAHLAWAGSPYAFHTVGSVLSVHYQAYAKVRGFPKRNGAEDFYLLNKLAKVGDILQLSHPVIDIQMRTSSRVPFGTGPAVAKLLASDDPLQQPIFYHPQIFYYLKTILTLLPFYFHNPGLLDNITELRARATQLSANTGYSPDVELIRRGLDYISVRAALSQGRKNSGSKRQFMNFLHTWLDGLRMLKLIHYLRDHRFPSVSLAEAMALSPLCDPMLKTETCKLIQVTSLFRKVASITQG